jgi:hypothetical protein
MALWTFGKECLYTSSTGSTPSLILNTRTDWMNNNTSIPCTVAPTSPRPSVEHWLFDYLRSTDTTPSFAQTKYPLSASDEWEVDLAIISRMYGRRTILCEAPAPEPAPILQAMVPTQCFQRNMATTQTLAQTRPLCKRIEWTPPRRRHGTEHRGKPGRRHSKEEEKVDSRSKGGSV